MKKKALISVYNKDKILELASFLVKSKWEIISTGGTSKFLQENKIPVKDVYSVTGFPECLDGRVKTLHPAIHAGILARRDVKEHISALRNLKLETIDLVCVNLYPFFDKVQSSVTDEEKIEFIDIGGPAMLRSAAKNFNDVIVLTDPADYKSVIKGLEKGDVPEKSRKRLAGKVFNLTSAYDAAISRYLLNEDYPEFLSQSLKMRQVLRYGENAHQSAALYLNADRHGAFGSVEQLHGKEMGYNNIKDLDIAWKAVCAFGFKKDNTSPFGYKEVKRLKIDDAAKDSVCCAAVKHNTPCAIALGDTLTQAYRKVFACDPVSIFGGIIACNAAVNKAMALMLSEIFLEIIAAPDFDDEALNILKQKKNLRIIKINKAPKDIFEYTSVDGGLLAQKTDKILLEKWDVVTKTAPEKSDIADMIFGMRAVTFVKSNAIMVVKELSASGIGGGQVNRIWPAKDALLRSGEAVKNASKDSFDMGGSPWTNAEPARVLASDAFFPFADIVNEASKAGIKAIIQPGGSVNDKLSIEACDKLGIAMVFTGTRHFKH
ncbi:MAG: bifunctional phosphoribosylaminoimidazolecarboxamide formyltransferase/IMP cyclohydrolase [Treponema sp.]|nr:bifunctional phosphoribosylaminoimidazolecarboxamide formyltransferase/IMP cyclohydrolase [Treponema sp.]